MNDRFIQSICIDWGLVEEDSYLRDIPALKEMGRLEFGRNITFFVGERGCCRGLRLQSGGRHGGLPVFHL